MPKKEKDKLKSKEYAGNRAKVQILAQILAKLFRIKCLDIENAP